jgi:hypothetical protein
LFTRNDFSYHGKTVFHILQVADLCWKCSSYCDVNWSDPSSYDI